MTNSFNMIKCVMHKQQFTLNQNFLVSGVLFPQARQNHLNNSCSKLLCLTPWILILFAISSPARACFSTEF
jgi:hypothetical protein